MKSALLIKIKAKEKPNSLFMMSDYAPGYMSDAAAKNEISRMLKSKEIIRYSYGIYFLPDDRGEAPDALDAIELRYLKRNGKVYGFYTGDCFLRFINGARQNLEGKLELASNHATSGKKTVYAFSKRFVVRKPYVKVDKNNVATVSFLTFISMTALDKIKDNYSVLANYIRKEHLAAQNVIELSPFFPNKVASKLIASDLYRSLWKH